MFTSDSVRRVPLPTYAFEHKRFWIDADRARPEVPPASAPSINESRDLSFYRSVWRPAALTFAPTSASGCWLVFNEGLGLADRITARLKAMGQDVVLVEPGPDYRQLEEASYTVRPGERSDYDALVADMIQSGRSVRQILHLGSVSPQSGNVSLEDTLARSFLSPLFLFQALAGQDVANLRIALVSNHLQQVLEEPVRNPARAVLQGLARVIPLELPGITCRSIDVEFEGGNPDECATQILAEMGAAGESLSVAYRGGRRFAQSLQEVDLAHAARQPRLEQGGVYLITGGLGGLGLVVAEHLAREFNARLVLVGRSALPAEAQWEASLNDARLSDADRQRIQKLIDIRTAAGGLLVARGDVTNLAEMRGIVDLATRQYGRIDGVFHAAGVLDDGPLLLKTAHDAARVLDPKVHGTLVLEEALRGVPLKCFVLFSSISSILPPPGQVDYAAANAFLDAFAVSRTGPVVAINWGAWREAGMAARPSALHPMLQEQTLDTPQELVYACTFSVERYWMLAEHRLKMGHESRSLLPGTGYMEMAAAALPRAMRPGVIEFPLEFKDVFFLVPLLVEDSEAREARVRLRPEQGIGLQKSAYRFSVFSRTDSWIEHCTGIVAPCSAHAPAQVERDSILARCGEREIVFDEQNGPRQERHIQFGPRWSSLRRLTMGKHEALAEIELDQRFVSDLAAFRMHPALLDLATGAAFYLTADYEHSDDLFLPISYKRMRLFQPLPARLWSHIRCREQKPQRNQVETFDISLFDVGGNVLVEIEGFSARRISQPSSLAERTDAANSAARAGEDQPIEFPDLPGIRPSDGARALVRILSVATPPGVVAVYPALHELQSANAASVPERINVREQGASPAYDSLESALAAWWSDLLGIEVVGLDDDFFDLGGHSLLGVRLMAKIKKTYRIDLDFGILFEARSVRHLADAIRKLQPETTDGAA